MCCYCMLLGWIHGSYLGLQEGSYRHSSHASGRVQRKRRYSRYGKGDCKHVTVWLCVSMCLVAVDVAVRVVGGGGSESWLSRMLAHIWLQMYLCVLLSFLLLHHCFGC